MASSVMARRVEELKERSQGIAARARAKAIEQAKAQKHTLIAAGSGYLIGRAESKGVDLPTIDGIDPKLVYGGAAFIGALVIKDKMTQQIAQSVADGLLTVCAYQQGKGQALFRSGS